MDRRIRSIVIGIAEIQEEDLHLAPAVELAEALGATLHVVHAFHLPDPIFYPYPEMSFFSPEAIQQLREGVQSQLEAQVRKISGSDRVVCRAVPVPADLAMLDVAKEVGADLLMVGATRRGTLGRTILGTTAQRVLRAASIPVLVNHRPGRSPPRRILLTTDLSEVSAKVHERGMELVSMLGEAKNLELRSLLVIDNYFSLPPAPRPSVLRGVAEGQLNAFLNRGRSDTGGVEGKVRAGNTAKEIVTEAEEWGSDLLVLGTHGRRGTSRFLIGSVAESVLRSAPCDVLVIPTAALTSVGEIAGKGERVSSGSGTSRAQDGIRQDGEMIQTERLVAEAGKSN